MDEARDDGVAVASAEQCVNDAYFATDRYPFQHLSTQFLQARQGSHSPGKLLQFCVRPGIFGMISRFTLVLIL